MKKQLLILSASLMLMWGCKKNSGEVAQDKVSSLKPTSKMIANNEWSQTPYKLNVIYFVPTDMDTVTNYKRRLSDILFNFQEFVANNMDREGFGRKSFGLATDSNGLVDIITIRAQNAKSNYTSDNYGNITTEINSYFTTHPEQNRGLHNLIITPRYDQDLNNSANNPFFGSGRNCFAIDYPQMAISYLGQNTFYGNKATTYIGGLNHELGHGLNLPHNKQTVSMGAVYGTALMGSGNYTYGKTPTFLSAASCSILSANQLFSTVTRSDWYNSQLFGFKSYKSEIVGNTFVISGRISGGTVPVAQITAYHDPTPYGANQDYDAPSFRGTVVGTDSFKVSCPLGDFYNTTNETQLRLRFVFQNGYVGDKSSVYTFNAGQPVISIVDVTSGNSYKLLSQLNNTSALDVVGQSAVEGTKVQIWTSQTPTTASQAWTFTALGDGYFRISPTHAATMALTVPGNVTTAGTQIQINTYTGATGQKWKIQTQMNGTFALSPQCAPESVLKIVGAVTTNGTKLELNGVTASNSWVWKAVSP